MELANGIKHQKKVLVVATGLLMLFNSVFDSTIPSGGIRFTADSLHVHDDTQLVLPTSVHLLGYVSEPLAFGPLSEICGRRIVLVVSYILFTIFSLACVTSLNWPALVIF